MQNAHLIDATTMMLRALNSKLDHLKHDNGGTLSAEGVAQLQKMMEDQTTQLKTMANQGVSEEKMQALLDRQMVRWKAEQNVFLTDSLKAMSEDIRRSIRERPLSPETANPHRHFFKEVGVVEDVSADVHLFFPLDATVKQPPDTFVLRNALTMEPMMINPVLKELMRLPKDDPNRALMANGLIPTSNLLVLDTMVYRSMILLDDERWVQACLGIVETENITIFPITSLPILWVGRASFPVEERVAIERAWNEQWNRLRQFLIPNKDKGFFNATLLLVFAHGWWPAVGELHPAYQPLQTFFRTQLSGKFIESYPNPQDTKIPREVFFLWTAVMKWNNMS